MCNSLNDNSGSVSSSYDDIVDKAIEEFKLIIEEYILPIMQLPLGLNDKPLKKSELRLVNLLSDNYNANEDKFHHAKKYVMQSDDQTMIGFFPCHLARPPFYFWIESDNYGDRPLKLASHITSTILRVSSYKYNYKEFDDRPHPLDSKRNIAKIEEVSSGFVEYGENVVTGRKPQDGGEKIDPFCFLDYKRELFRVACEKAMLDHTEQVIAYKSKRAKGILFSMVAALKNKWDLGTYEGGPVSYHFYLKNLYPDNDSKQLNDINKKKDANDKNDRNDRNRRTDGIEAFIMDKSSARLASTPETALYVNYDRLRTSKQTTRANAVLHKALAELIDIYLPEIHVDKKQLEYELSKLTPYVIAPIDLNWFAEQCYCETKLEKKQNDKYVWEAKKYRAGIVYMPNKDIYIIAAKPKKATAGEDKYISPYKQVLLSRRNGIWHTDGHQLFCSVFYKFYEDEKLISKNSIIVKIANACKKRLNQITDETDYVSIKVKCKLEFIKKALEDMSFAISKEVSMHVFLSCLDVSAAHVGGCIVVVSTSKRKLIIKDASDPKRKQPGLLEERDTFLASDSPNEMSAKTKLLKEVLCNGEQESFEELRFQKMDRRKRRDLIGIDGAVVIDSEGKYISIGAIVDNAGMRSNVGARTAAAEALCRYGMVAKISADGNIDLYPYQNTDGDVCHYTIS